MDRERVHEVPFESGGESCQITDLNPVEARLPKAIGCLNADTDFRAIVESEELYSKSLDLDTTSAVRQAKLVRRLQDIHDPAKSDSNQTKCLRLRGLNNAAI